MQNATRFLLLGFVVAGAAAQITPTHNDVLFGVAPRDAGGTVPLFIDIYIPPGGSGPFPVLVWIHGGGWSGGTHNNPPPAAQLLLMRGIAIASISYRLSGEAIFPAQIHDVKGAVRFIRANAQTYNFNPARVGSWGSSAGGHLSALLGMSGGVAPLEGVSGGNLGYSSRVQACVDYFGPTDILHMNPDVTTPPGSTLDHDSPGSPESHLVGWDDPGQGIGNIRANLSNPAAPYPALVTMCNQVNPVTWVTPDDPPTFIGHGMADTLVPLNQSTRLAIALQTAGLAHEYRQIAGAGHGSLGASTDQAVVAFLASILLAQNLPGDLNCDGSVGVSDIGAFVLALTNPAGYAAQFPNCSINNADLNQDGTVSVADIGPFVALLSS